MLFCNSAFAQVSYHLKVGANLNNTYKLINNPDYRVGWYGGAKIIIPISEKFAFQPELLFSSKGFSFPYLTVNDTRKTKIRYNYLTIPILLNYKLTEKMNVGLGPEFGYLLNVKQRYPFKTTIDISNHYPVKWDFGLDAHLGYQIKTKLNVEIRYNYGFRTFYYTDGVGTRVGESLGANRVLQLGISYLIK